MNDKMLESPEAVAKALFQLGARNFGISKDYKEVIKIKPDWRIDDQNMLDNVFGLEWSTTKIVPDLVEKKLTSVLIEDAENFGDSCEEWSYCENFGMDDSGKFLDTPYLDCMDGVEYVLLYVWQTDEIHKIVNDIGSLNDINAFKAKQ